MWFICALFVSVFRLSHTISRVQVQPFNMYTTDLYNEKSTLLYSGKNLAFFCVCPTCDVTQVVNENGTVLAAKYPWVVTLEPDSISEKYYCKDRDSDLKSTAFELNYLLCDDDSEVCKDMKCPADPAGSQFCVMEKDKTRPSTCQTLPKTCDPGKTKFGDDSVGQACVHNNESKINVQKSLCRALSENEFVMFITIGDEDLCKSNKVFMKIPDLDFGVSVGYIGKLGSSIEFNCSPNECQLNCTEKLPNATISEQLKVKETFDLSTTHMNAITKITCKAQDYHLYLYNVRINASVGWRNISNSTHNIWTCVFWYPMYNRVKSSINITFYLNGSEPHPFEGQVPEYCGFYICEGTVTIKNCNPFFEKTEKAKARITIKEGCRHYTADTTTATVSVPKSQLPFNNGSQSPEEIAEILQYNWEIFRDRMIIDAVFVLVSVFVVLPLVVYYTWKCANQYYDNKDKNYKRRRKDWDKALERQKKCYREIEAEGKATWLDDKHCCEGCCYHVPKCAAAGGKGVQNRGKKKK